VNLKKSGQGGKEAIRSGTSLRGVFIVNSCFEEKRQTSFEDGGKILTGTGRGKGTPFINSNRTKVGVRVQGTLLKRW